MHDGKYTISSSSGKMIGAFEVVENEIHNLWGIAQDVLQPGPVNSDTMFALGKLQNGYIKIERQGDAELAPNDAGVHNTSSKEYHKQYAEDRKKVYDWAEANDHHDPEFLLKLLRGL